MQISDFCSEFLPFLARNPDIRFVKPSVSALSTLAVGQFEAQVFATENHPPYLQGSAPQSYVYDTI